MFAVNVRLVFLSYANAVRAEETLEERSSDIDAFILDGTISALDDND